MSIAFLFPGQGAQTPGFFGQLPAHVQVDQTFDEASAVLGRDAREFDRAESLASTVGVQLCGLIAGVAVARALDAEGVRADAVAGLSSGAYTAAVVCGSLRFADALALLKLRAELMEAAYPQGFGLAAIVGLDETSVARIVETIGTKEQPLYLANLNSPTQFVLAGSDHALESATAAAKQAGARTARKMAVSVPSHCVLMQSVATRLIDAFTKVKLSTPTIPYMGNVSARALRDGPRIGIDLATNVAHAVRWHDAVSVLYEMGVRYFFEAPPGAVLTGLMHEGFDGVDARSLAATPIATVVYIAAQADTAR